VSVQGQDHTNLPDVYPMCDSNAETKLLEIRNLYDETLFWFFQCVLISPT
jgi:hypothetical protein